jgi:PLP dependent protein
MTTVPPDTTLIIAANVRHIRERMASAASRSGRSPEEIHLIGVSKTHGVDLVIEAIEAGVTDFGENYIQEARVKIAEVSAIAQIPVDWHFIGHLQSNKARYSVELFSLVQTVDKYQLAQELSKHAAKRNKVQEITIEVNLSGETQRAGVLPADLPALVDKVCELPNLALRGLMGMPPRTDTAEEARPYFRSLYRYWEMLPENSRQVLSMGMSGDFEVAIEEGATHVRIGTALFGIRTPH